jgi:hypothetical protein
MRQPIHSIVWSDLGNGYLQALWASGNGAQTSSANDHLAYIAWPIAGTFQNMIVKGDLTGSTWTLFKNGSATAITATTAGGEARDVTHTVTVVEGDRLYYVRTGSDFLYQNEPPISMVIEFESDGSTTASAYGFAPNPNNSSGITTAAAGALGSYGLSGARAASNTVSVCPIAGTIIRNTVFFEATATDATKGYRCTIWKNGVAQNGSGGTPDTRVEVYATSTAFQYNSVSCTLAVAVGDRLEQAIESINSVNMASGASCVLEAAIPGQFAICGSNQSGQGAGGPYAATTVYAATPGRWGLGENIDEGCYNIGAVTSFSLTQLQWFYNTNYPAGTGPVTFKLFKNSANPANQPTLTVVTGNTYVQDSDASHVVQLDDGDTWSTVAVASNTGGVQAHWSFAGYASSSPPPTPPTDTDVYAARRLRQFSLPTSEENKTLFLSKLEFLMETGVGLSSGQGSDPQVMIQISRDWGHTWGVERWVSAGLLGQYQRRVILRRLGRFRSGGVVRVAVSDPIPWTFLQCLADLEEGTS